MISYLRRFSHSTNSQTIMDAIFKNRVNNKSFHRIKEGATNYFDRNQFLGIDPFDGSKFKWGRSNKKAVQKNSGR